MPIRPRLSLASALAAAFLLHPGSTSAAQLLRVVTADDKGVTLRLEVPLFMLSAPDGAGRSTLSCPGLPAAGDSGRPALPLAAALLALPPGARASVRLLDGGEEEVRAGVKLAVEGRTVFRDDGGQLGKIPVMEPVAPRSDGPWPREAVELGEPVTVRRVRMVDLRVWPFRYDEASGTLSIRRALTVRVDFSGGAPGALAAPEEDRHGDPVLEGVVLNFQQARGWRQAPLRQDANPLDVLREARRKAGAAPEALGAAISPAARTGFDEDNAEVRVLIDTTGVYALSYDALSRKGYPSGIPVNQVSVHRHEFVEGASPPYVTVELPIEMDDRNGDGIFNTGDRILVFVQNWAERSRASVAQRDWGNAEVVYATFLTGKAGLRTASRSGWLDQSLGSLRSYRTTQRFEQNTFYFLTFAPAQTDTNTDQFLWTGLGFDINDPSFSDVFPFETNDLDTTRQVTVTVQWQGLKQNPHITSADVRNGSGQFTTVVDGVLWDGNLTLTRTARLTGSALSNGRTNSLRVWGRTPDGSTPIVNVGLNWFEETYARRFKSLRGYLACNSDSAAGSFQIQADGFSTRDIRVYDVTDSLNPVRLSLADTLIRQNGSTYSVLFQDSSASGAMRRYVVFDVAKAVAAAQITPVTRRNLYASGSCDYLLITPEAFLTAAQTLADLRTAEGLRVLVAPLESVNDEFNGGRKSVYSVRRLIRFAYNQWNAKFVLLFGDGNMDPRNQTGTAGPDLIPVQKIPGPVAVTDGLSSSLEANPSDTWYVIHVNDPVAHPPYLLDLDIGRLPVKTPEQAADMVSKLVEYENVTPDQVWRRRMLILADDQYSTLSSFSGLVTGYCFKSWEVPFIDISRLLKSLVIDEAGLRESDAYIFNLADSLANEPTVPDPTYTYCRQSYETTQQHCHLSVTPKLLGRLNNGCVWWNFQGHANPLQLTHETVYLNLGGEDDLNSLTNDKMPFLFSAFSCHPNAFGLVNEGNPQIGPALGEEMVTYPRGGAIASWGSSGYELIPTTSPGGEASHLNMHFARALFSDPPHDPYLGQGGARAVLGESVEQALFENYKIYPFDGVGLTYQLLGDPATRISIGRPQAVVTANGLAVEDKLPVRLRTPGDSLRLEADLVSNVRIDSLWLELTRDSVTSLVPPARYTLDPAFPGTASGDSLGRRFHLTYRDTLVPDSYTFTFHSRDSHGVEDVFQAVFPFQIVLRADGVPVDPNDPVGGDARLELTVLSPAPLTVPTKLAVTLDEGADILYSYGQANGDTTGREWTLRIPHADFVAGRHLLRVSVGGRVAATQAFVVGGGDKVTIQNAYAFPNPFDERGTFFTFGLFTPTPADVQIRVFTVSGRLIYQHTETALGNGQKQIGWNGLDAEGQPVANGIYIYRLIARAGGSSTFHQGQLVKLRRPVHALDTSQP